MGSRSSMFRAMAAAAALAAYWACSPPTGGNPDGLPGDDGGVDPGEDGGADADVDGDVDGDGDGSACDPGVEFPAPEDCNRLDDDCDGEIDEDMRPRGPCATDCGAGEDQCIDGAWVCVVTDPAPELCDGLDDDCDGEVDEGLERSTGSEFDCAQEVCEAGTWVRVSDGATEEVCNGRDDDCDGEIDEDQDTRPCWNACGLGLRVCLEGEWVCNVAIPMPEVCDNRDNDCDGAIDESLERECPCGSGVETCDHGVWVGDCDLCTTGAMRWCDDPTYCHWGQQVCTSDGEWGPCVEVTTAPDGCTSAMYDTACCVAAGECCQDFAHGSYASVGDCEDECPPG